MTNDASNAQRLTRRNMLTAGGAAAVGAAALGPGASQSLAMSQVTGGKPTEFADLPFKDPEWNRDAWARLLGDMDFETPKYGWYEGVVHGVRDGEVVKPLFGFSGFSSARLFDEDPTDGVYEKALRELVYYTDLETGEVLEEWTNPYTDETVKVVPVLNDAFDHKMTAYVSAGPDYGGLRDVSNPPKIPLLFPWGITRPNTVTLATDIHLYYPNALTPEKWPRESSGPMNRVSELFRYVIRREELQDPAFTSVEYTGSWTRITPWLPWTLMGQSQGHIFYTGSMGGFANHDMVNPKVRAYAEKHHPIYFEAPTEYRGIQLSSLENYAREQTPAPVKK